ncbi:probable flavin-containing monoamine oxidase A [Ylistrum balloti]|uniref:probable flavin-containing monoamine oxidase A n=1 Tax=Ylistrum balloti TaxID=509963 RepID=UPI002905B6C7|nr:probable flavin-containing monoamine oxidase A [Ylistrum balloti]
MAQHLSGQEVDVVVVGGGLSGLTAAYHIHRKDPGLRVLVLEAKDRVGGRTFTVEVDNGVGKETWDLGGQWVGRCQPHITKLLNELGLKTYPQYIQGRKFMQLGGDAVTSYTSNIPSLSGLALIDLQRMINRVEKLRKKVDARDPYNCQHKKWAAELDGMSLDSFMRKYMWTKGAMECIDAANRTVLGVEASQVSVLFYVMYVSAAGGIQPLIESSEGTGQESKIIGGSQQISNLLVDEVGKDNVLLEHPVDAIKQDDNGVHISCKNGTCVTAKRVVIATPPQLTGKITFSPPLPPEKQQIMKRMVMGDIIKVIITFKEVFWRSAGQSGEVVTDGGPTRMPGCDRGPLCIVYDNTSYNGTPALLAFIGGKAAVQWRCQEALDRKSAVLKSLSEFFGPKVWSYVDYIEKDWGLEPYIEGAPTSSVAPGSMEYLVKGLRHPFLKIHFAGTESATVWCGFMNGAVQAGLRAANEVLYHLRPQLVSPSELLDTVYGPDAKSLPDPNSRQPNKAFRWMIGLLVFIGGAWYLRRKLR